MDEKDKFPSWKMIIDHLIEEIHQLEQDKIALEIKLKEKRIILSVALELDPQNSKSISEGPEIIPTIPLPTKINVTKSELKENSKKWIFTFKIGSKYQDHYAEFYGTKESAFEQMISRFGHEWSNQYSEDEYTNSMGLENVLYHNG